VIGVCMYICVLLCLFITREWVHQSPPNFQGSPMGILGMVSGVKKLGVVVSGPENLHFLYPTAPSSHAPLQAGLVTRHCREAIAIWQTESSRSWCWRAAVHIDGYELGSKSGDGAAFVLARQLVRVWASDGKGTYKHSIPNTHQWRILG